MEVLVDGINLVVYQNGTIQLEGVDLLPIEDTRGDLIICIHNQYYKVQNIIALVYFDVDLSDTSRRVTHIDKNKKNNSVDNLCIKQLITPWA